jgi:hypothetical protein
MLARGEDQRHEVSLSEFVCWWLKQSKNIASMVWCFDNRRWYDLESTHKLAN